MEQFFENPKRQLRLRECPLGPYIEAFVEQLIDLGYTQRSVESFFHIAADFGCWLEQQRVILEEITEEHVKHYLEQSQPPARKSRASPLRRFLGFLRQQGIIAEKTVPILQTPAALLAGEFSTYLRQERALVERTIIQYLGFINRFLKERFADGEVDLSVLCAADVVQFVERQAADIPPKQAKDMTTALRSFLKYARYRGDIALDLAAAVPTVANWAKSSIPKFLSPDQIELVLAHCNRQTAIGRRDYAILLLLARLGLRGGEVAALTLDDIDWESGYISVCGKGSRWAQLPLPVEVGEAITAYLKNGRPSTTNRRLFLRGLAPAVGFWGPGAISLRVREALKRARIDAPCKGAHLFRHSLATGMLGRGASLAEIGELLRHQSSQTTTIYAKVDFGSLRPLALPWPGGEL